MKITLNTIPLCRGSDFGEYPQALKIKGSKEVHIAQFLQASAVQVYDKGNTQTLITFQNIRRHESLQAAHVFLFNHANELSSAKGDLLIEVASGVQFILPNASLRSMESSISANATQHFYEVVGGVIGVKD